MIPGRLRECLKTLRWKPTDLAEQLGRSESEVTAWLDGRAYVPVAAAAWLEALVKAHKALPPPRLGRLEPTSDAKSIKLPDVKVATRASKHPVLDGITVQVPYRHHTVRFSTAAGARPMPMPKQRKGASDHEQHPL